MATEFEARIAHGDARYAAQAAQAAFSAVDALEAEFSRFLPASDVNRLNRLKPGARLRLAADTFACLERCAEIHRETAGAFDITVGAYKDPGRGRPRPAMDRLVLHRPGLEVAVTGRVSVDLGAVGKGFAVDRMAEVLREWDVAAALVHGGRSSVFAFGCGPEPGRDGWPVTLSRPSDRSRPFANLRLRDGAMGASGLEKGPHILDPATGKPADRWEAAWVFAPDAASADAYSTAFMVMDESAVRRFVLERRGVKAALLRMPGEVVWIPEETVKVE